MDCEFQSNDLDIRINIGKRLLSTHLNKVPIILNPKKGTTLDKVPQEKYAGSIIADMVFFNVDLFSFRRK